MENATKALIIAGSVLIVIVLIALGINILGSTSDVTDQVDSVSESMAQSVFNSQFTSYFDNSTSGTQAKSLISKVISNNSTSDHKIFINFYASNGSGILTHQKTTSGLQSIYNQITNTARYKIRISSGCGTYSGGYNNGYVACISIHTL